MTRLVICCALFLSATVALGDQEFVVAPDGSGDFETIQGAIDAMKSFPPNRITIRIRNGTYREKVIVHEWNTRLMLVGEDPARTIISFDDYFARIDRGRNSTFFTPTVQVNADDFVARNLTIENSAGEVGQAIALAVNANRAVFRNVRFLGSQDTLYVTGAGNRMFFDECYIEGTTDFIFGGASAVFRNCEIHSMKNSYITAASTREYAPFGLVFINAELTAKSGVDAVYLGRPWRQHAQTVFIHSDMGSHILPEGWHNRGNPVAETTTFYAEHASSGPGGDPSGRVAWATQLDHDEAARFTVELLLSDEQHPSWWAR